MIYRLGLLSVWLFEQLLIKDTKLLSWIKSKLYEKAVPRSENKFDEIKELKSILPEEIIQNIKSREPFVLRGYEKLYENDFWSWEKLENLSSDIKCPAFSTDESDKSIYQLSMSEILKNLRSENPRYALFSAELRTQDKSVDQELSKVHTSINKYFKDKVNSAKLIFANGKGKWTKLHSELGGTYNTQVHGTKTWYILKPKFSVLLRPEIRRYIFLTSEYKELKDFPKEGFEFYKCTLSPGDILYCPPFHWHMTECHEPSLSIGQRWSEKTTLFKHPFLSLIVLTARNPSVFSFLTRPLGQERHSPRYF